MRDKKARLSTFMAACLLLLAIIGVLMMNYSPELMEKSLQDDISGRAMLERTPEEQGMQNLKVFLSLAMFALGAVFLVVGSTFTIRVLKRAKRTESLKDSAVPEAGASFLDDAPGFEDLPEGVKESVPASVPASAPEPMSVKVEKAAEVMPSSAGAVVAPPAPSLPTLAEAAPMKEKDKDPELEKEKRRLFAFMYKTNDDVAAVDKKIADIDRRLKELDKKLNM